MAKSSPVLLISDVAIATPSCAVPVGFGDPGLPGTAGEGCGAGEDGKGRGHGLLIVRG